MRRWKLVGVGAALLALVTLRSPWRGHAAGADVTAPVHVEAREAPGALAPESSVLRGALVVSFAAGAHAITAAKEPDVASLPLHLATTGRAAGAAPVALSEPPLAVLGLVLVAGLRALACRPRAI